MKKRLHFETNNSGFYLPYTMFVSMIVFVVLGAAIAMYQNNVHNTYKLMELTEVETMTQMTRMQLIKTELHKTIPNGQGNYVYPYGEVDYSYQMVTEDTWEVTMAVTTKSAQLVRKIYKIRLES